LRTIESFCIVVVLVVDVVDVVDGAATGATRGGGRGSTALDRSSSSPNIDMIRNPGSSDSPGAPSAAEDGSAVVVADEWRPAGGSAKSEPVRGCLVFVAVVVVDVVVVFTAAEPVAAASAAAADAW
jgi:hypothetical protein